MNSERLREKYLSFVFELGETQINGKKISDHQIIEDDFSLWWMSLITEKSPYKSSRIIDCVRIFALEEIINKNNYEEITFESGDRALAKSISQLCRKQNIKFSWRRNSNEELLFSRRSLYLSLPHFTQGAIYLFRHLVTRWKFRKNKLPKWSHGEQSILFVSNLFNIDIKKAEAGIYHGRQWEELQERLLKDGLKLNMLHHFLYSPQIANTKVAVSLIDQLNKNKVGFSHLVLDSFLDIEIVFRVVVNWMKLMILSTKLKNLKNAFVPKNSNANFWELLKDDWKSSLTGSVAIANLIWVELFKKSMKHLPRQKICLYLNENQGWERAFLYFWKKYQRGCAIAVPHTVIRFWDIRYFMDSRVYVKRQPEDIPLPDKIAVNGIVAHEALLNSGTPSAILEKVEALRFQYLCKYLNGKSKNPQSEEYRVLILGDFTTESTLRMMGIVKGAVEKSSRVKSFTLKPHPACVLESKDLVGVDINNEPLTNILDSYDVAFASNTTASALDAYIAGLRVLVYLDENDFNYSPLKGADDVVFVSDLNDFISGIELFSKSRNNSDYKEYFWLDEDMKKWSDFLKREGVLNK